MSGRPRPTVLMVLDGWGIGQSSSDNAIETAPARNLDELRAKYPSTQVAAHGRAVGLMADQMGDSNVGHLTIGAGRVVDQNLPRISSALADGSLQKNPVIQELLEKAHTRRLHVMGLLSPGGVHSHQDHLAGLMDIMRAAGLKNVFYHLWLDGRDVPPQSAASSLEFMADALNRTEVGQIATVAGRYYAMDRDTRWDRTEKAYRAMVEGVGRTARSAIEALMEAYARGENDEFVEPTVLVDDSGEPVARILEQDLVLIFNFRADRVRQISRALADPDWSQFARPHSPNEVVGMTQYDENFGLPHVLAPQSVPNSLAEWLSVHGLSQLHVAETEKYAHVTFFFNGGIEQIFPGEDRILIPSPKVATYDLAPAMSAEAVADRVVADIEQQGHDFILLNFANSDMVGHTGKLQAARQAIQVVDAQIGRIAQAVLAQDGALVIVADHGNAEIMRSADGQPHTNHTTNPVPFVVVASDQVLHNRRLVPGQLQDVAPTVLDLLQLPIPNTMTGHSLLR